MDLVSILLAGLRLRASDVHLTVGSPPLARVDGQLCEISGFAPLNQEVCKALVYSMLYDHQRGRFEADLEFDASLVIGGAGRFRVNVLSQRGAVEAVFRVMGRAREVPFGDYIAMSRMDPKTQTTEPRN